MAAKKKAATLEVAGQVIEVSPETLTLGEVYELETEFEAPIARVMGMAGEGYFSVLTYLAYILKRRKKPDTTLEDIGKVEMASVKEVEENPTKRSTPAKDGTSGS